MGEAVGEVVAESEGKDGKASSMDAVSDVRSTGGSPDGGLGGGRDSLF